MGKKKHLKVLKRIAQELPDVMAQTHEVHYVLGAVLIAQGHQDVDGLPINPVQRYEQTMPVLLGMNHKRRMKRMFIAHGPAGVNSYIKAVKNLKENIV